MMSLKYKLLIDKNNYLIDLLWRVCRLVTFTYSFKGIVMKKTVFNLMVTVWLVLSRYLKRYNELLVGSSC